MCYRHDKHVSQGQRSTPAVDKRLRDVGVGMEAKRLWFVRERQTVDVINVVFDFLGSGRRWYCVARIELEGR